MLPQSQGERQIGAFPMSGIKCPNCGLYNPDSAQRCDCGYDFGTDAIRPAFRQTDARGVSTATMSLSRVIVTDFDMPFGSMVVAGNGVHGRRRWLRFTRQSYAEQQRHTVIPRQVVHRRISRPARLLLTSIIRQLWCRPQRGWSTAANRSHVRQIRHAQYDVITLPVLRPRERHRLAEGPH